MTRPATRPERPKRPTGPVRPTGPAEPRGPRLGTRARLVALGLVAALLAGGTAAYLLSSRATREQAIRTAPTQSTAPLDSIAHAPRIVFRNTAIGLNYGRVAMVPEPASCRAGQI